MSWISFDKMHKFPYTHLWDIVVEVVLCPPDLLHSVFLILVDCSSVSGTVIVVCIVVILIVVVDCPDAAAFRGLDRSIGNCWSLKEREKS